MPKIKILSDSTCDLSKELIDEFDIGILPLYVNLGGNRPLRDGVEVSMQGVFDYVDKTGELPGTIAASVEDFHAAFEEWTKKGFGVVCHTISSEMSCSYQNAVIAAADFKNVYVVDTRNLSTGVGLVVLSSAGMAREGMTAPAIVEALKNIIPKVNASFVIDTLDYLQKGGRCSSLTLLSANMLKIKPSICVKNGAMSVGRKFRGSLDRVLMEYVDMQLKGRKDIRTERIFITHTGCAPALVKQVEARIRSHMRFDAITETLAGATIASHAGPNTLGILFIEK